MHDTTFRYQSRNQITQTINWNDEVTNFLEHNWQNEWKMGVVKMQLNEIYTLGSIIT